MTGYDLQMHLRYRKSISNKETNKILFMHKNIFTVPVNLHVLTQRMSAIFLIEII